MARVYATRSDLEKYAPEGVAVPEDSEATRQLTRASERIERATSSACYDTDATGLPSDEHVAAGMRDAVCALVVHWIDTGDESGDAARWSSVSIGSINLSGNTATAGGSGPRAELPEAARTHLDLAGLLDGVIYHR